MAGLATLRRSAHSRARKNGARGASTGLLLKFLFHLFVVARELGKETGKGDWERRLGKETGKGGRTVTTIIVQIQPTLPPNPTHPSQTTKTKTKKQRKTKTGGRTP